MAGLANLVAALGPALGRRTGKPGAAVRVVQFRCLGAGCAVALSVGRDAGGGRRRASGLSRRCWLAAVAGGGIRAASVVPSLLGVLDPVDLAGVWPDGGWVRSW